MSNVIREVAKNAEPTTICTGGCECDMTPDNVWNSDGIYIVIDGVTYWANDDDVPNAWENPMCKECSQNPRNLEWGIWED